MMKTEDYAAQGNCPYCGKPFERNHLQGVCHAIECNDCHRWFVVKTHVTISYTAHRVEGEITRLRVAA